VPESALRTQLRRLYREADAWAGRAYAAFGSGELHEPVFVVGCGRSGTTILGSTLGLHRHVTYLNEPRHLWHACFPETDVTTARSAARRGRVVLTAADADPGRSRRLRRVFRYETLRHRRPVLVEKLPINNFRLPFLLAIFPRARFVHIHRNGLEVARSIEKLSERGRWFERNPFKWDQLVGIAGAREETAGLPARCTDWFHKGLLEWRLSTEAVVSFLRERPDESFHELSYRTLVESPERALRGVLAFTGLDGDPDLMAFARDRIRRRSEPLAGPQISATEREIGGPLLAQAIAARDSLVRAAA